MLECNARLSGVPDISLHLGGGGNIKGQGLHPCVRCVGRSLRSPCGTGACADLPSCVRSRRLARYEKDGTLSFIPPDGRFRLMDFTIAPASSSSSAGPGSALSSNFVGGIDEQSGVRFKTRVKLNETGCASSLIAPGVSAPRLAPTDPSSPDLAGTFEISISSAQPARPLENVVLRWNLGDGVVPSKTSVFGTTADDGGRWEVEGGKVRTRSFPPLQRRPRAITS